MYQEGLSAGTMKSYLAAMRHAQIALGLGDPVMVWMPQLQYVLKGCRQKAGWESKADETANHTRDPPSYELAVYTHNVVSENDRCMSGAVAPQSNISCNSKLHKNCIL